MNLINIKRKHVYALKNDSDFIWMHCSALQCLLKYGMQKCAKCRIRSVVSNPKKITFYFYIIILYLHPLTLESSKWHHIIYNNVLFLPSDLFKCVFLNSTDAPCCWTVDGLPRFSWLCQSWYWVRTANLRMHLGSSCPSKVREHFWLAFSWCAPGFLSICVACGFGEPCELSGIYFSHVLPSGFHDWIWWVDKCSRFDRKFTA